MIIEEALVSELENDAGVSAIVVDRIYPITIPVDATLPAIAYQRIGGPRELVHAGVDGLASPRFQITCQGDTYAQAKSLSNAVRAALNGFKGLLGGEDGVEVGVIQIENETDSEAVPGAPEWEKNVTRLDALIWHQE